MNNFLRPTQDGYQVFVDNYHVADIVRESDELVDSWVRYYATCCGERITELGHSIHLRGFAHEIKMWDRARQAEDALQQQAEIAAEQGYELYLETRYADEHRAFEDWERSRGVS